MFHSIADQRLFGNRLMVALLWGLCPVVALAAGLLDAGWARLGLGAAGFALAATLTQRFDRDGQATRLAVAVSLMGSVSLLVAAFAGRSWQIDLHMAYFAALATLIVYCDWKAIAVGAAAVAVHHLLLSFVLPSAVFPGGGDLGRVVLHAVILVAEAAVLIWAASNIAGMFASSAASLVRADEALKDAEAARQVAEDARAAEAAASEERRALRASTEQESADLVAGLAGGLERLAAGDLAYRIDRAFPAKYERMRADYNAAIASLELVTSDVVESARNLRRGRAVAPDGTSGRKP